MLEDPRWPDKFPFRPENFLRYDESPDSVFYSNPRFVTHIDDNAINALTKWVPAAGWGGPPRDPQHRTHAHAAHGAADCGQRC